MVKSRWKNGIPNSVRQKIKDKEKMAKIRAKIEKGTTKPKKRGLIRKWVNTGYEKDFTTPKTEKWRVGNKLVPAKDLGLDFLFNRETLKKIQEHKTTISGLGISNVREENGYYISTVEIDIKRGSKKITQKRDFWVKDGQGYYPVPFDLTPFDKSPAKGTPKDTPGLPDPFNKSTMKKLAKFVVLNMPTLASGTPFMTGSMGGFAPSATDKLNSDLEKKFGSDVPKVKHVYSAKSRVIKPSDKNIAVKLDNGKIGWIDKHTLQFLGSDEVPTQVLRGLDMSWNPMGEFGPQLEDLYNQLTPLGKARFSDIVRDLDWDMYWNDVYNAGDIDTQEAFYEAVQTELLSLLNRHGVRSAS